MQPRERAVTNEAMARDLWVVSLKGSRRLSRSFGTTDSARGVAWQFAFPASSPGCCWSGSRPGSTAGLPGFPPSWRVRRLPPGFPSWAVAGSSTAPPAAAQAAPPAWRTSGGHVGRSQARRMSPPALARPRSARRGARRRGDQRGPARRGRTSGRGPAARRLREPWCGAPF